MKLSRFALTVLVCLTLRSAPRAFAQFSQQGPKLVATDVLGLAQQGFSVSLSGDGNTAIVGCVNDNLGHGAASIWIRSGGLWTQQGPKLVGSGAVDNAEQGISVALSSDGNTAIVGGLNDNSGVGAVWVWTRNGGEWTQQGTKLVGSGALGPANQGTSVALSADGNTAIIGGANDNSSGSVVVNAYGAAWVWTRSGGVWNQQGSKLVGSGAIGYARQGGSVSISADGNTAIVGGPVDNIDRNLLYPAGTGAAWIWTRSAGVWAQQGPKLVGAGAVGNAEQGVSVSLSADGNTAIVGGDNDNNLFDYEGTGAAWIWTRSEGVWTQQGPKLVGAGAVGHAGQGGSVCISADGNKAIVAGYGDDHDVGAGWIWIRSKGDWIQQGPKLVGSGNVGPALEGLVSLSGDGRTAILGGPHDNNVGAAWIFTAAAEGPTPQRRHAVGH